MSARAYRAAVRRHSRCINPYKAGSLKYFGLDAPVTGAAGSFLHLADGRKLLDFCAGFGAATLGHNPRGLTGHMRDVIAAPLPNLHPWGIAAEPGALAARLLTLAPGYDKVHFALSGSEAVETAIKVALAATGRTRFAALRAGYHGSTCAATALNDAPLWRDSVPQHPLRVRHFGVEHEPELAEQLHTRRYAALILEVMPGSSGLGPLTRPYLQHLRKLCRATGTLLIVDEVMTGLGRCGAWLGYQRVAPSGFAADVCVVSKGLTGGMFPISAVLMTEAVYAGLFGASQGRSHGSTFSNYRIGAACGLRMLDLLHRTDAPARAARAGAMLASGLRDIARRRGGIAEPVGLGLSIAFRVLGDGEGAGAPRSVEFLRHLIDGGVLATLAPCDLRHVRITPPLNVSDAHVDRFLTQVERTVARIQ